MRSNRTGAVGAILAAVALLATACGSGGGTSTTTGSSKPALTIGGANFSEATLLAYIYGDALKNDGFSVSFKTGIGPRETVQPALQSGQINFEAEYAGSLLAYYDPSSASLSAAATASALQPFLTQHNLAESTPSAAADSDSIDVNSQTEAKYHLTSIDQLAPLGGQLTFGGSPECRTRKTCLVGLTSVYGIHFKNFVELDSAGPLTVNALKGNQVQVADLDSTDPHIDSDHFTVLADPKHIQQSGNILPEFAKSVATPELIKIANAVSSALTTSELRSMDAQLANQVSPQTVAQQFVSTNHLS